MVRVLIADDERLFVEALEVLLGAEAEIEVVGKARTGAEAVELARELDPNVVLMDLSMPGMDSFEAIEAIRSVEASPRVVVLTGSANPDDMERARAAGAFAYVTKENIGGSLVPCVLEAAG